MKLAFLGLGNMGQPMARNLAAAKFDLIVWNRSPARADDVVKAGATAAPSVAEAARVDVALTMVADDAALEAIVFDGRLLETLPAGAIHVSMSTISVALAEKLAAAHAARGSAFVSAPVFGRPDAAAAGKLFIVAAGPSAALETCQPIFDALGQRTFRVGAEARLANLVKLSGNFLLASIIESLAEAFALVRKAGVDPHEYLELLTGTLFTAPLFRTYGTLMADRRYQPAGFRMRLGLKDVTLALDAARAATVPLPVASLVRDHMISALAQGRQDDDWSALAEIAARNAGL